MTVVVLLGAPGAGKGTQAPVARRRDSGCPVLASGDLLRARRRGAARRSGARPTAT